MQLVFTAINWLCKVTVWMVFEARGNSIQLWMFLKGHISTNISLMVIGSAIQMRFVVCTYVMISNDILVQISPVFTIQLYSGINCLSFVVHFSHYSLHSITESQCLSVVQYSLSSMSSSQVTCPYDSSCHLKGALMQRWFVQHTPVMQVLPASPELWVQVYQRLSAFAAKTWMVTCLWSLIHCRHVIVGLHDHLGVWHVQ